MTEQFKINRAGEPAKEKHLLWWLQSNKQRPINICPPLHQDLLEMVGNFPFAVFLLSFKSAVQCFLWTQYQAIVCGPVNRSINCSDSEAFPPMCWLWRLENNKWGRKKGLCLHWHSTDFLFFTLLFFSVHRTLPAAHSHSYRRRVTWKLFFFSTLSCVKDQINSLGKFAEKYFLNLGLASFIFYKHICRCYFAFSSLK